MDGFKNTTRMKYMTGGPVKKAMGGMTTAAPATSSSKIITPEDKAKYAAEINSSYRETKPLGPRAQAQNARMGPVKRAKGGSVKMSKGGTFNEKGKRATLAEMEAEDRRMAGRPSEGVSTRPTTASGRRASNADLGMVTTAKKTMKKATGGGVFAEGGKRAPKPMPPMFIPGTNGSSGGLSSAYVDARQKREDAEYKARMVADAKAKKATGVRPSSVGGSLNPTAPTRGPSTAPAFNDRPMIRRKTGGLAVMPKGKC